MPKNRFEQVDEPQMDAMTLSLGSRDGRTYGEILCPAAATGRLPKDYNSGELPAVEAFRSAVKLANDLKIPIVVADPNGLWQAEWGELYRAPDDPAPDSA